MIITAICVGATVFMKEYIRVESGLRPSTVFFFLSSFLISLVCFFWIDFSVFFSLKAASIFCARIEGLMGFSRKSKAPSLMAETAVCISPYPVIIITGTDNCFSFNQLSNIIPSPSGNLKSDKTMS